MKHRSRILSTLSSLIAVYALTAGLGGCAEYNDVQTAPPKCWRKYLQPEPPILTPQDISKDAVVIPHRYRKTALAIYNRKTDRWQEYAIAQDAHAHAAYPHFWLIHANTGGKYWNFKTGHSASFQAIPHELVTTPTVRLPDQGIRSWGLIAGDKFYSWISAAKIYRSFSALTNRWQDLPLATHLPQDQAVISVVETDASIRIVLGPKYYCTMRPQFAIPTTSICIYSKAEGKWRITPAKTYSEAYPHRSHQDDLCVYDGTYFWKWNSYDSISRSSGPKSPPDKSYRSLQGLICRWDGPPQLTRRGIWFANARRYDKQTRKWTPIRWRGAPLPQAVWSFTTAVTESETYILVGGIGTASSQRIHTYQGIARYDPDTNTATYFTGWQIAAGDWPLDAPPTPQSGIHTGSLPNMITHAWNKLREDRALCGPAYIERNKTGVICGPWRFKPKVKPGSSALIASNTETGRRVRLTYLTAIWFDETHAYTYINNQFHRTSTQALLATLNAD